jgi:hypothetical protein
MFKLINIFTKYKTLFFLKVCFLLINLLLKFKKNIIIKKIYEILKKSQIIKFKKKYK